MSTSNLAIKPEIRTSVVKDPSKKKTRKISRISVKPALYEYAITRSGKKLEELVTNKDLAKLPQWLSGDSYPTERQLNILAAKTNTPIGYFFLDEPPPLPQGIGIANFRVRQDQGFVPSNLDIRKVIHDCIVRQEWLSNYRKEMAEPTVDCVRVFSLQEDPAAGAEFIERQIPRPTGFTDMKRMLNEILDGIERLRVLVNRSSIVGLNTHRTLHPDLFSGFAISDPYAPLIFINSADYDSAKVFTAIHELAHLLLGETGLDEFDPNFPNRRKNEIWCNRVAGNYLVPKPALEKAVSEIGLELDYLSEYFNVSRAVISIRLLAIGAITQAKHQQQKREYLSLHSQRRKGVKSNRGGGNFYATHSRRVGRSFAKALLDDTYYGKTSIYDAEELLGIYGSTFERFSRELGYP